MFCADEVIATKSEITARKNLLFFHRYLFYIHYYTLFKLVNKRLLSSANSLFLTSKSSILGTLLETFYKECLRV